MKIVTSLVFTLFAVVVSIFLNISNGNGPPKHNRPNIILILADDAGYADFGFQGSSSFETPNLDYLSKNGVTFNNAYVSSSVCTPSRAGILTGRYANRFGVESNLPGQSGSGLPLHDRGLPLSEITTGNVLKDAGYKTGFIGKWHLGTNEKFYPENRGFDEFFGILTGYSDYRPGRAAAFRSNFRQVDIGSMEYVTDELGSEAIAFIQRHANENFFLQVSFTAPHPPMHARDDDLEKFIRNFDLPKRAKNAAMVYRMDVNIGKIINQLTELGLLANTLIIFTNDNGGSMNGNGASNYPLRGSKGSIFEGGIKVPLLMYWPLGLPQKHVIFEPVSTLDILPTVVAASQSKLPLDRDYDGINLLPYLNKSQSSIPSRSFFWRSNWAAAIRTDQWKLIRTPDNRQLLFEITSDPSETNDLSGERQEIVKNLSTLLQNWEASMTTPSWTQSNVNIQKALKKYR